MDKPKKLVIIVQESVLGSIVKDIFTFVMFAGLMYFNHKYLSGSTFIDMMFIILIILFLTTRSTKDIFRGSKAEAIKWLKDK